MALFHSQNKILSGRQRGRFYLHEAGIDAYGKDYPRRRAKELWGESQGKLEAEIGIVPYVLGIFFAYQKEPVLDLFIPQFRDIVNGWKNSPIILVFQDHKGELTKHPGIYPCSDAFSILAREEEWRRKTRGLEHYLAEAPRLPHDLIKLSF